MLGIKRKYQCAVGMFITCNQKQNWLYHQNFMTMRRIYWPGDKDEGIVLARNPLFALHRPGEKEDIINVYKASRKIKILFNIRNIQKLTSIRNKKKKYCPVSIKILSSLRSIKILSSLRTIKILSSLKSIKILSSLKSIKILSSRRSIKILSSIRNIQTVQLLKIVKYCPVLNIHNSSPAVMDFFSSSVSAFARFATNSFRSRSSM